MLKTDPISINNHRALLLDQITITYESCKIASIEKTLFTIVDKEFSNQRYLWDYILRGA